MPQQRILSSHMFLLSCQVLMLYLKVCTCNQEVKRRWFADRWTQQSCKVQRWRSSVAVMSAIHTYCGTTVCVLQPVRASVHVQTTSSTAASCSSTTFRRHSAWRHWTTLHTWHVTSTSTQHNSLTLVSISVLKDKQVSPAYRTQAALSSLLSVIFTLHFSSLSDYSCAVIHKLWNICYF